MKAVIIDKKSLYITSAYIITILMYSLMTRFFFTHMMVSNVISQAVKYLPGSLRLDDLLYLIGIPVLVLVIVKLRKSLISLDGLFLLLFSCVVIGVAMFDPEIAMWENVKSSLYMVEFILISYYTAKLYRKQEWEFFLDNALMLTTAIWAVGCLVSFYYYLINYSSFYIFGNIPRPNPQGLVRFRLYGAFSDANLAAVVCVMLVIGNLFYLKYYKTGKIKKSLIIIAISLFVIYIDLAFSRTAYVTVAAVGVFVCLYTVIKLREKKQFSVVGVVWRTCVRYMLYLVAMVAAYFVLTFACQMCGKLFVPERDNNELVREEVFQNADMSNGRFEIWKSYMELFEDRPIFGYSADAVIAYAQKNHPDSYVAQSTYNPHNMYINLLIIAGCAGFVSMMIFIVMPLFRFLYLFCSKRKKFRDYEYLLFLWAVVGLSEGLFYVVGFTDIRFESVVLWLSLGGIYVAVRKENDKTELHEGVQPE